MSAAPIPTDDSLWEAYLVTVALVAQGGEVARLCGEPAEEAPEEDADVTLGRLSGYRAGQEAECARLLDALRNWIPTVSEATTDGSVVIRDVCWYQKYARKVMPSW